MVQTEIDYLKYMERIEDKIGQKFEGTDKNSADKVEEQQWLDVVIREINQISVDIAKEIQKQTTMNINKGTYTLEQHEAPFSRLLALEIGLAAWLGWILNEKALRNKVQPFSAI
jgi:hypothetical protein